MATETVYGTEMYRMLTIGSEKVRSIFRYFVRGDSDTPLPVVAKVAERENPGWTAACSWVASVSEWQKYGKLDCIDEGEYKPKSANPFDNW